MSSHRVAVTLVGGFLGAGKTTLLNHILSSTRGQRRFAVVVNDFGKLAVDASLVDHADEEMLVLSNGCVCCSLAVDLQRGLLKLLDTCDDLDEILIETSGVTRIEALVAELERAALAEQLEIRRVVVVVDAVRFPKLCAAIPIVSEQVSSADVVLLNRCDLVDDAGRAAARHALTDIQPHATILETEHCRIDLEALKATRQRVEGAASGHTNSEQWFSAQITIRDTVQELALRDVLAHLPSQVERVKGLVRSAGGRILKVERAGDQVEVTPWIGKVREDEVGVLVAIGPERVSEYLRACFASLGDVEVTEDDSSTFHES